MAAAGALAQAPAALGNVNVGLELVYQGPLSRVQLAANVDSINQFMALITPIGQVLPEVFTRVDPDMLVEELEAATGIPARIIRSINAANEIRAEKAKQAQQAQVMAAMQQGSEIYKNVAGSTPQQQGAPA